MEKDAVIAVCPHRVVMEVVCALVLAQDAVELRQLLGAKHIPRLGSSNLSPAGQQASSTSGLAV
jgi:hypothetical protein